MVGTAFKKKYLMEHTMTTEDVVVAYKTGFVDGYGRAMSDLMEQIREKTEELNKRNENG